MVWPVLLLVMLRFWKLRTVVRLTAVLAAGFLILRFILVSVGAPLARLYNGPDTRADQLLLGCVMALLFSSVSHGSRVHTSPQAGACWAGPIAGDRPGGGPPRAYRAHHAGRLV
ncbi:hypothetical protein [Pseudarthrobacter sulfonivorans]|uniref:hypothetical protein n=1 Tax=Pseudarthrobacter sulfonivorans TaxID=121292 RepID=UPI00285D866F|nr:hypothetical protein [Pseudarthrobacter sulfonivorans]MDR6413311.1 peptidoglycan/LPS O-acetylase OafA/YrhL [Pseudarthrobacter sulfonivorans]